MDIIQRKPQSWGVDYLRFTLNQLVQIKAERLKTQNGSRGGWHIYIRAHYCSVKKCYQKF